MRLSFCFVRNLIDSPKLETVQMLLAHRLAGLVLCCALTVPVFAVPATPSAPPVTVTDDGSTYTMSNGYLTVKVDKVTGDLVSVKTPNAATLNIEPQGYARR